MGTLTTSPGTDPAPPSDKDWATLTPSLNAALQHDLGVPPASVKVTGVRVRNATPTTGEAEVEYNQPITVTGDDNWVRYALEGGQWKDDCKAPIGNGSRTPGMSGVQGPGLSPAP
jgi:hypothetical protein